MGKILAGHGVVGPTKRSSSQHLITGCDTLTQRPSQERFQALNPFISFTGQYKRNNTAGSQNVLQGRLEELLLHESDFCVKISLRISFT